MADVIVAPDATTIADNLRRVRDRIADAAIKAGRKPEDVTLVAVSKTKPIEAVRAALAAGQTVFGENRVQEASSKFPLLRAEHRFQLHIIGGLQTNKAREAVQLADVIETLDRPRLADAIAAAAEKAGRLPTLLIEVNTGDEPQKSGVARDEADGFIAACKARFGATLAGLMCVPPLDQEPGCAWAVRSSGIGNSGTSNSGIGKGRWRIEPGNRSGQSG
jgi:pyridoxal phosphate enzyme (YggS family)